MTALLISDDGVLNSLAQREGWQLDSPMCPTRAHWRLVPGDPDVEVAIILSRATIMTDGITAIIDLTGCSSVDEAVMRIEEESQLITG
ncbi:hypothetical protein TPB0596_42090 [Tsukamurella pulmonis]|uniref:hypothetical protein n=1 Tax=Tsukamurella pulmonis TaxID=47312 RepID=UPI001EE0A7AC|nr:hypothetical protein [Tsukamurella pulmonis]BDD84446.1 hypothetical protein TPB0596_42090 [Tsukamurella pulmonis]